jgi:hypothetical protein
MEEVHVRRFREKSITLGNPSIAMLNEWQRRCRVSSRSLNELLEVCCLMIESLCKRRNAYLLALLMTLVSYDAVAVS